MDLLSTENQHDLKKRIFRFLEEMANSEDKEVQNVLIVTVLERLGDSEGIFFEAKKYMGEKTNEFSTEIENWLGRR